MTFARKHLNMAAALLAATAAVAAVSCGGSSPSTGTPPVTTTPTTTLASSGGGAGASCPLGMGSVQTTCEKSGQGRLANLVETAINMLVQDRPALFDLNDTALPNTDLYKVRDTEAYLDGIVANLRRQGACAERDQDDFFFERVLVKDGNAYSEAYDLLLSTNHIRRTYSGYLETCTPASFPIDRASPDIPPAGTGCGRPYPPPVTRFNIKEHMRSVEYYTIDSTPMVGPDVAYCAANGFTDGRSICPVRPEGAEDRSACENWRVGKAKDTGKPGPTWKNEETGSYCTGPQSGCLVNPDNQYQVFVYNSGIFRASAENGAYGLIEVGR